MSQTPDTRVISISEIKENPVALRAVNRESEEFIGLRDSIREVGILNAINVRLRTEEVDGQVHEFYELVDGLHRYTAALDCGVEQLAVTVMSLEDTEVLEAQMMANVHKIDTRPIEYTRQMTRIFAGNPTMTVSDMAARVCKSPPWVSQRLGLLKLAVAIQELVDDSKITISNAVSLSKLPESEQANYVDQAMTMGADEFAPTVQARAKELRKAAREGRDAGEVTFEPVARLQKLGALKDEYSGAQVGPSLCETHGATTGPEGFALGVAWALNLDPVSVAAQRAKADEKRARLEDAKKKRKADRAQKKAEEAATAAAKAAEEASA